MIEILRSIPTIPLWMGLAAAACPRPGRSTQVYFAITVIISLIGWTELGRVVRGRFLALREEDFVTAAELAGRQPDADHLPPHGAVLPHAHHRRGQPRAPGDDHQRDLALFLGLGLRPPAISWGVLLQDAQNIQALALALAAVPADPVIVAVLAFNFLGDGLRDAADPYG